MEAQMAQGEDQESLGEDAQARQAQFHPVQRGLGDRCRHICQGIPESVTVRLALHVEHSLGASSLLVMTVLP